MQLAGETPSHILAPAIHMTRSASPTCSPSITARRRSRSREALLAEARRELRQRYFEAEVGITGANFLIAETGSVVLVTNEGNAELTQGLPKIHIVIASLEKVVPTLEDACTLLRVLARSATGQEFAAYTTVLTGPKRPADLDGPTGFHVVLVDNGRSAMIGSEFQDILRCIRCGACMNHCPVYLTAGGHAYGWVYPGPMGAVLTPSFIGIEQAHHLPSASTFCGRCEQVCPVRIPLPKMMRHWREQQFTKGLSPAGRALRHPAVGVRRQAAGAVPRRRAPRGRAARPARRAAPAAFAPCPWPAAGPARATSRRRRGRPSRRSGAPGGHIGERGRARCGARPPASGARSRARCRRAAPRHASTPRRARAPT